MVDGFVWGDFVALFLGLCFDCGVSCDACGGCCSSFSGWFDLVAVCVGWFSFVVSVIYDFVCGF